MPVDCEIVLKMESFQMCQKLFVIIKATLSLSRIYTKLYDNKIKRIKIGPSFNFNVSSNAVKFSNLDFE